MRALIVEDEKTPRELLRTLVPWGELGFDRVDTARHGREALPFLEQGDVDVVLTDVRMPKMDGIELAVTVRDRWPRTVLLFLSAHSDKEYLRSAIRLQAQDYLDKPIEIPLVTAALRKAADEVRLRRVDAPLRRQMWVQAALGVVQGDLPPRWTTGPLRVVIAAPALGHRAPPGWAATVVETVNRDGFLEGAFAAAAQEGQEVVLVAPPEGPLEGAPWETLLGQLQERLAPLDPGGRLRLGVAPVADLSKIGASVALARQALADAFYRPEASWLTPRGGEPRPFRLGDDWTIPFKDQLARGESGAALKGLDHLEARALAHRDPDLVRVRSTWSEALGLALDFVPAWGPGERQARLAKLEADLAEAPHLGAVAELCRDCFRRLFVQAASELHTEDRVKRAQAYMEVHFADPDLTVDAVAAHVGYSESYFCTVFKQTTGTTVKDHVTKLRIERAKAYLWEKTPPTLADLALKVGYRDPNYFSTVFKRLAGTSPGAYRKRALG